MFIVGQCAELPSLPLELPELEEGLPEPDPRTRADWGKARVLLTSLVAEAKERGDKTEAEEKQELLDSISSEKNRSFDKKGRERMKSPLEQARQSVAQAILRARRRLGDEGMPLIAALLWGSTRTS